MAWVKLLELNNFRNIPEARLELAPGLNIFTGRNAQGKTSLLEAVGVVARGRSFRTDDHRAVIRRGAASLHAAASVQSGAEQGNLAVELLPEGRRLSVNGAEVGPRDYWGRLEAFVYSTDRLRVVHGPMRERRHFVDRGAAALWPSYRQLVRDFQRVLLQRNAALETRARDLDVWTERFLECAARLRYRRCDYARRLNAAIPAAALSTAERYEVLLTEMDAPDEYAHRQRLQGALSARSRDEERLQRTLVGPHRDAVSLRIDGRDAAEGASSGQARSLLLALTLASLEVYRAERGHAAVALLDDLDSELDEQRAAALCAQVSLAGQALVTTAHAGWARSLPIEKRTFEVVAGQVTAAS